jgi:hypothetical protein
MRIVPVCDQKAPLLLGPNVRMLLPPLLWRSMRDCLQLHQYSCANSARMPVVFSISFGEQDNHNNNGSHHRELVVQNKRPSNQSKKQ